MTLASLQDVTLTFPGGVHALDGVSLDLPPGTVTGLVGESGSGKTTLCRVLLGLVAPDAGTVQLDGQDLAVLLRRDRLAVRRRMQMLLQDAPSSLSPRLTVRQLLMEPVAIHRISDGAARVDALLARLRLLPGILDKYPHQISGGQARRVAAARALVLSPALLVADEPTAGLDVSVQGELLNLLAEARRGLGLTDLIASHNLPVVRRATGRMAVMYLGQIVEQGPTATLFAAPAHPYTAALLSTSPSLDPAQRHTRIVLAGEIPSPRNPPPGCRFHTRCWQAQPRCTAEPPALRPLPGRHVPGHPMPGQHVRCHFPLAPEP